MDKAPLENNAKLWFSGEIQSPPPSVWKIVKPRGQISVYRIIDVQMFKIVVLFGLRVKQLNVKKYKIFLWRRKKNPRNQNYFEIFF